MVDDDLSPIKVTISRTKKITEHIPEDVSRAKASAWLTIISPITEWAGLKGDELHHKRDILRLEREGNLYELGQKLKKKLAGANITPIKNKILIPALERASLESPDEEFIELWANLLAAEAVDPADDTGLFSAILAELGHSEARLLNRIQDHFIRAGLWDPDAYRDRLKKNPGVFGRRKRYGARDAKRSHRKFNYGN